MLKTILSYSLIVLLSLTIFSSCKKDDDSCTAPSLSENIIGTWSPEWATTTVEFNTDGTLDDPGDALIGAEVNGVVYSDKTYNVVSDEELYVRAADPNNSTLAVEATVDVTVNECDKITISLLGAEASMNRE